MNPREHTYTGAHNASANINGKEVNITINLGGKKPMGSINLAADLSNMPEGVVSARTQRDLDMGLGSGKRVMFSNPKHNVRKLGFKEGMKVADFGSGSGAYSLELANLVGKNGKVYAVDVQRDLLTRLQNEATQAGHENIEIIWGDMEEPGTVTLRDTYLDGVLCANILFQLKNKIAAIKEVWRVLKPGGVLAVIDWTDSFGGMGPVQNAVITQPETMLLCTDNGFAFKGEFSAGDHHYGLQFVKMVEGQSQDEAVSSVMHREKEFVSRTIGQELI